MTLLRLNNSGLTNRLANDAFYRNFMDSNLGSHHDCKNVDYNVTDEDAVVKIEFAIPGLSKDNLEIELNNEILTVKTKEKDKNDSRTGFAALEFEKSFKISDEIQKDKISARSEKGVLYIALPKITEAIVKPAREIEIA